jgi:hypothetical protein
MPCNFVSEEQTPLFHCIRGTRHRDITTCPMRKYDLGRYKNSSSHDMINASGVAEAVGMQWWDNNTFVSVVFLLQLTIRNTQYPYVV